MLSTARDKKTILYLCVGNVMIQLSLTLPKITKVLNFNTFNWNTVAMCSMGLLVPLIKNKTNIPI